MAQSAVIHPKFHHFNLKTTKLQEMIDWYSTLVGAEVLHQDDVGAWLSNDKERGDVEEYCVSEGWVKVPAGKTVDRKGRPLLIKLKGKVEAYYR